MFLVRCFPHPFISSLLKEVVLTRVIGSTLQLKKP